MNSNIITIGVPVFNEEKYIAQTLSSLLNQSLKNWKAIVSDNCSTDNTYKIAEDFSMQDKRILTFRQKNKVSALENFISTLNTSDTKYFAWLGGHDLFENEYLEYAVNIFESKKKIAMIYPKSTFVDIHGNILSPADSDINSNGLKRVDRMCKIAKNIGYCTAIHGVFRRELLSKAPFKKIIGSDNLIIFSVASYGEIYELPFIGIRRRIIRHESYEDKKERWRRNGLFYNDGVKNLEASLCVEHFKFILKSKHIKFYEKIILLTSLKNIFQKKYRLMFSDFLSVYAWKNNG